MLGGWFTAPRPARVANAFARRSVGIHKSGAPFPGRHPKGNGNARFSSKAQGSVPTTQHRQTEQSATH